MEKRKMDKNRREASEERRKKKTERWVFFGGGVLVERKEGGLHCPPQRPPPSPHFKNTVQPRGLRVPVRLALLSGNSTSCGIIKNGSGRHRHRSVHVHEGARGSAGASRPPDRRLYSRGIKFPSGPILLF